MRSGRVPVLDRRALLQELGVGHRFRNQCWRRAPPVPVAMVARTMSSMPTGTVDLSAPPHRAIDVPAMVRATSRTYCRSALPSSSGGVPTAMNSTSPWAMPAAASVRRSLGGVVGLHHRAEAGLVDRHDAAVQPFDLGRVHRRRPRRGRLRQAGAGHQAQQPVPKMQTRMRGIRGQKGTHRRIRPRCWAALLAGRHADDFASSTSNPAPGSGPIIGGACSPWAAWPGYGAPGAAASAAGLRPSPGSRPAAARCAGSPRL